MIPTMYPCIIKHHGSVKYLKYIILASRNKGLKSIKSTTKILAAASSLPAASVRENTHKPNVETSVEKDNVIGGEGNASSLSFGSSKFPSSSEDNCLNGTKLHQEFLKPIKPDVTVAVHDVREKPDCKEGSNSKTVKLLNAVKPSDLEWHRQVLNLNLIPTYYKSLSKFRLSGLVVLTTLAGYGMAPGPLEPVTMICMVIGTGLTSAAANAINQILEVPYDSQMARTKNRVLTRGLLTPLHAFSFAICSAAVGLSTLYFGTNTLTTILGVSNLILYTSVYTPLKRCSIVNTWLGSVVGAIPPLMGWAACTGTLNSGGILLGAILYAWQFPHFNALSWNLRPDYSRAGYRMTSVIDPDLCRRTALRYSALMLALCTAAPVLGLTTWTFAFDSFPLNCYLIYCSWHFYKKADSQSSRKLFRLSLIHLPTLMLLMFIGKKYKTEDKIVENNL